MGKRCPLLLSVRCHWDGDVVYESARAVNAEFKGAYEQGGGCVYCPRSDLVPMACRAQDDGAWCLGECQAQNGPPADDACWACTYAYSLDCLAGKHGHQRGIVLQVVERDRQLGSRQHEELAMAQKRGVPIFVCETQWQDIDGCARQTFIFHSGSQPLNRQDMGLMPELDISLDISRPVSGAESKEPKVDESRASENEDPPGEHEGQWL